MSHYISHKINQTSNVAVARNIEMSLKKSSFWHKYLIFNEKNQLNFVNIGIGIR